LLLKCCTNKALTDIGILIAEIVKSSCIQFEIRFEHLITRYVYYNDSKNFITQKEL